MPEVVAEYKVKVDEAVKNLQKLEGAAKDLDKSLDKAATDGNRSLETVGDSAVKTETRFSKLKLAVVAAFAAMTTAAAAFAKESVQLAAKAEGIQRAFNKLNSPTLLSELRKATRGTVSDLELMQKAVQANNFKLPLDKLAQLFKFATDRAIETGESVDYLVESIVLGISRKSIPIMDNLGISSVELQNEMKKTGDFAQAAFNIINRSMAESGEIADTTAVKLANLTRIWDNFQVTVGNALINLGTGFSYLLGQMDTLDVSMTANSKAAKNLAASFGGDLVSVVNEMVEKNEELLQSQLKIEKLRETLTYQNSRQAIKSIRDEIASQEERQAFLREYIKELKNVYDASTKSTEAVQEEIKNVAFYKQLIQQLTEEQDRANTTLERNAVLNTLIADATEKLNALLGKETQALKDLKKALDAIAKEPLDIDPDEILSDEDYIALGGRIDKLGDALQEAFGQEGSAKIQSAHDEWLESQLAAMDEAEAAAEEYQRNLVQLTTTGLDALGSFASGISTIVQQGITRDMNEIQRQYDAGEISREQFEKKQRDLQRQSAQAAKDAALFQAIIGTSQAVINALATTGVAFPVAVGFAALAAAQGAIQIAAIANEPLPQFKEGGLVREHGLLRGKSHAHGGIAVEAEGNEYFMPTAPTMKNLGLLEAMRKGVEEKYIMEKYVMPKIDGALLNGWGDIGKSMELNNITANLKDHNIIASQDRMRQSMTYGLSLVANKLDKLGKRNSRSGW